MILGTLLAHRPGYAAASPDASDWTGQFLARISLQEQDRLSPSLSTFFGDAEGDTGSVKRKGHPEVGASLFRQFSAVMVYPINMSQYRLPTGRVIWAYWDKNSGVWVVVAPGTSERKTIAATALLTHLCPRNGVVDKVRESDGRTYQTRSQCELDSSLLVFYAHGDTPDPNLNADLTKWALASMEARQRLLASKSLIPSLDRKLLLKRFVRVLDGRAIELQVADAVFPLDVQATVGD